MSLSTSDSTQIVTRFAPSPTGALHIGGARTALFNWLFARGRGGKFLLRIEDTDKARSTPEATTAIFDGLSWLGLDYDDEAISQVSRADRHAEVALELLAMGKAYKCFSTPEEINAFREAARAEGGSTLFRSPWRDVADKDHPVLPYAVRLRAPRVGKTIIRDEVQGDVTWSNDQLDDMILLRSDGSPVYMLAVVVDDHDMGVTHVIRGDDHLANAARQMQIYISMGWPVPIYAHVPLIFGPDGKKLSKRHGATGAAEYRALGYCAAGMRNYLARLGWSHGNDEFFSDAQAKEWFDLSGIGKSPARLDFKKLENICGQHNAVTDDAALLQEVNAFLAATDQTPLNDDQLTGMQAGMYCLKERAKTFGDLIDKAHFVLSVRPISVEEKAQKHLTDVSRRILSELTPHLQNVSWSRDTLEGVMTAAAESHDLTFGKLAGPLRAALAGRAATPSVFDMMLVLGRDETIARIEEASQH